MQLHLKLTVVDDKEGPKKREGNIGLVPADESNRSNKVVYRLKEPNRSEMENRPKNATLLGQSTDFDIKFSNLLLFFLLCVSTCSQVKHDADLKEAVKRNYSHYYRPTFQCLQFCQVSIL